MPARVSEGVVVVPNGGGNDDTVPEAPLLPPAIEQWLRKNGRVLGICFFLVAATVAVYGQTVGFDFVSYDDNDYVYENRHVKPGLSLEGIKWALTHVHSSNWHPLTTMSHMLDCSMYGLWPGGHHLTNVLLHAVGSVVLFLALRRLTGAVWRSGMVAALFCLHPLHVESVAWVSERKDVLSGLFFGLTLWAYAAYAESVGSMEQRAGSKQGTTFPWARYLLVVVLFALGLMCKPMLVTLPFLLLLLDYWPLRRMRGGREARDRDDSHRSAADSAPRVWLVAEKLPLMALSAASCAVTYFVQRGDDSILREASLWLRLQTALHAYCGYLAGMVWPTKLAAFYPLRLEPAIGECAGCFLVLAGITAVVLRLRHRAPYLAVGWFWYLGMLVPVSGIILISMADRYTYLPLVGIFIGLTWGAYELLRGRASAWSVCIAALLASLCAAMSAVQARQWQSSVKLWEHAIAVNENNSFAQNSLATELWDKSPERRSEAFDHWREALRINPNSFLAHYNLGRALSRQGNKQEAIDHLQLAVRENPRFVSAYNDLGLAQEQLGLNAGAELSFREALRLDDKSTIAYDQLAHLLVTQNRWKEAVLNLRRAVELEPDDAQMHLNLGVALVALGSGPEAIEQCEVALRIDPNLTIAHHELAKIYHSLGRLQDAGNEWMEVLSRQPGHMAAAKGMGMVLVKSGRGADAIPLLKGVLAVAPQDQESREYLVFAHLAARQMPGAMFEFREIQRHKPKQQHVVDGLAEILKTSPKDLFLREFKAYAHLALKQPDSAIAEFREILRQDPKNLHALNSLAWIEATSTEAKLRNGKEAVTFAETAAKEQKEDDAATLDTLAAAYAEAGRFKEAVETAQRAKKAAEKSPDKGLVQGIDARLKLYEAGKAYRE